VYILCKTIYVENTLNLVLFKNYYLGKRLVKKWPTGTGKGVLVFSKGGSNLAPWDSTGSPLPNPVLD